MQILTLSAKQLKTPALYSSIKKKHILISIASSGKEELELPSNVFRVGQLFLKFDDVEDIDNRYVYFDRNMAKLVVDFVDRYCNQIELIIVQCEAGLSRSVAIGSALSKIINYTDDAVFTKGIPNMFVYTTMLDFYFSNVYADAEWRNIKRHRQINMSKYLTPAMIKLSDVKNSKRVDV